MTAPKVSIVIPVYNTEKYLRQCIETLTSQTLKDIEIIMVDDGSKDECARLCDEIAEGDSRIKVIHKRNEGPGLSRNVGIAAALGEYVGFVDSDDYVDIEMYNALYDAAKRNDADLVISGVSFVGGNTFSKEGDCTEKRYFEKETIFENDEIRGIILGVVGSLPNEPDDSRYGVSVWKNIFRRSLICDNNISFMSERKIMSEDAIFMVDFLKHARKAVGESGAYYCYRRNDASFSKSYKSNKLEMVNAFLSELELHISDIFDKNEYKLYLERLVQGYGRILCSQEIMYAKEMGVKYSSLRERLSKICTSEKIANALKTYPWYKLPKKQAAFAFAMKYKLYRLQKLMVTLRAR